ncbi:diguanylate cyclase [Shewanella mangrovi]|uniref:Diguanylate cyclase n=1 Tax=Shewanella mangrovi TaxID=1515746 RepID=A0A094JC67_9GAMM|nr:GGDEF domain-containing response regulator [Shewanella mangrovi]KFZ36812.1 diguanylate cyclase [Shewanella mangrovi]
MDLLLIDDDEIDRTAILRALASSSLAVNIFEANSAKGGLELVAGQSFDGILLDYRLPDADGLEMLAQLHQTVGANTAVVMISRYEDESVAERCIELGAQDFLLKDEVNPRRLTRAIRQAQQRAAMAQELKHSHEQLKQLAELDSLTQLANRYGFETFLHRELAKARCQQSQLAIILLDLDDFKQVNDILGHQAGDHLLEQVAARLLKLIPPKGMIARIGGDEFVAVLSGDTLVAEAEQWAQRLLKALQPSYLVQNQALQISASAGIAYYGALAKTGSELLRCADIAMYKAKRDGRNRYQVYSNVLNDVMNKRHRIAQGLKYAITDQQLRLFYQGKFAANSGKLVGCEALLRWQHPEDGMMPPDAFLPIAEELGMMDELAAWVLNQACLQNQRWLTMLPATQTPISVAVNLSPSQNLKQLLLKQVTDALQLSSMPAKYLELELTENALIEDSESLASTLCEVQQLGVSLALDDFGTGFSSLEHIKDFPIQVLKLDKSFVLAVDHDERSRRLLRALLNFAKGLDVIAVAEGVETACHAEFCRTIGCDILQGYHYCKPLPADEFEQRFIVSTST